MNSKSGNFIQLGFTVRRVFAISSTLQDNMFDIFLVDFLQVLDFSIPANAMDTSTVVRKISQENKFFCGQTIAVTLADNTIQILDR